MEISIENGSRLEKELNNSLLKGMSYHIGLSNISKEEKEKIETLSKQIDNNSYAIDIINELQAK